MRYFVYSLLSKKNGDIYVGSTEDVKNRFKLHNEGRIKSTKAYCPWELLEVRECKTRSEAMILEKYFKTHQQKEILKRKYKAR